MGEGEGGLNREGGLINFPPLKRGDLLEKGGLFERGGLIEDLRYSLDITAKFVVSRCAYCKLRRDFEFFCSTNHFSEGGVNANHNVIYSPSLAENNSRLLKNS